MPKPEANIIRIWPKNKLAGLIPKDGLDLAIASWDAIESHASYKSNFDRRGEAWVFVKAFDGNGSREFRATSQKGWYRVTAGITVDEPASRELISWLHHLKLVTWEVVQRSGPLITRTLTVEERQACRGPARGRPLEYPSLDEHDLQVAALRIMKRRDAK